MPVSTKDAENSIKYKELYDTAEYLDSNGETRAAKTVRRRADVLYGNAKKVYGGYGGRAYRNSK